MSFARVCILSSTAAVAAITVAACGSSSAPADVSALNASEGGSGSSSDSGAIDGSPTGSGMPCGRYAGGTADLDAYSPCADPTPVCCAREGKLSCVATGACAGGTVIVGCRPASCPTGQVCCGSLLGSAAQSSCETACTGFNVQLCNTAGEGPPCPAGFVCMSFGIIDSATGYCSPSLSIDGGP